MIQISQSYSRSILPIALVLFSVIVDVCQAEQEIFIHVHENMAPLVIIDEHSGEVSGIITDIYEAILGNSSYKYRYMKFSDARWN